MERIRADVADVAGADVWLTGATAVGIDVSDRLADALPSYLLLVVGPPVHRRDARLFCLRFLSVSQSVS